MRPVFQPPSKPPIKTPEISVLVGSGGPSHMVDITVIVLNLWLQPLTEKEVTSTEEGVLWWKPRTKTSPVVFLCVHSTGYCLSSLVMCSFPLSSCCGDAENGFVLDPGSHFCTVSQQVEWRRVRHSSGHLLSPTQQKRLRHEGDRAVGGFESCCRRMNLLTYVGTFCLFLSVCLWLLSRGIKHIVTGLSRGVWKIRRMRDLFVRSWWTLRVGLNVV